MTRPLDDTGTGTPGRARKRVEDLIREAREVRHEADGWLIRAPMDVLWQRWRRLSDPKWAEQMERDVNPEEDWRFWEPAKIA